MSQAGRFGSRHAGAVSPEPASVASSAPCAEQVKPLTFSMLSEHTLAALNANGQHGSEKEKRLVGLVRSLISEGKIKIPSSRQSGSDAHLQTTVGPSVMVLHTRVNDKGEYDVMRCRRERVVKTPST